MKFHPGCIRHFGVHPPAASNPNTYLHPRSSPYSRSFMCLLGLPWTLGVLLRSSWEGLLHIALRLWSLEAQASLLQGRGPGYGQWQWEAMEMDARGLCSLARTREHGPDGRESWVALDARTESRATDREASCPAPSGAPGTALAPGACAVFLRAVEGLLHLLLRAFADNARPDLGKARLGCIAAEPTAPAPGAPQEGDGRARGGRLPMRSGSAEGKDFVCRDPQGVGAGKTAEGAGRVCIASRPRTGAGPNDEIPCAGCSGGEALRGPPPRGRRSPSADFSAFQSFVRDLGSVPTLLLEECVDQALGVPWHVHTGPSPPTELRAASSSPAHREASPVAAHGVEGGAPGAVGPDIAWGEWLSLVGSGDAGSSAVPRSGPQPAPQPEGDRFPRKGPRCTSHADCGGAQASLEDLLWPILQPRMCGTHEVHHCRSTPSGQGQDEQGATARAPMSKHCGHGEAWGCSVVLRQALVKWCLRLKGAFVDSMCRTESSRFFAQVTQEQQRLLSEIRRCREVVESGIQALHC